MKEINNKKWNKFLVKSLFGASNTGNILWRNVEDGSGSTPYVTASAFNNGVVAHIDASKYTLIKGHCILVGGKTFTLTYQEKDFVSNDSHNFELHLLDNTHSYLIYLFLITVLRSSLQHKYMWNDAVTKEKLLDEKIWLPINSNNRPDWEYMENYMFSQRKKIEKSIEKLHLCKICDESNIDLKNFKRFHLYDEQLFMIDSGTKLDKIRMTTKNPQINFVGRANAHNGVTDYIDIIEGITPYKAGNLTVSLGGEYLGSCFIQEKDFYTSQNVNVLIPKHEMTMNCKQYIATMIFREGRLHYKAFIDELNRHIKRDFTILLPIDNTGKIDWDYMEKYMCNLQKRVKKNLTHLLNIEN